MASSHESPRFSRIAIRMPPTIMIGTETAIVQVISASIWTCCTSLVLRVISEGAPNWATSRPENVPTRSKIAARRSWPKRIAVRAENQTATTEQPICSRETPSITAPARTM